MDHALANGTCESCHISDKPSGHISSPDTCGDCHDPTVWTDIHMDHTSITEACASCHITDKPSDHIDSSSTCDACHSTTAWSPAAHMDHTSVNWHV